MAGKKIEFILPREYSDGVMKRRLYHGSPVILRVPVFGAGDPYNDYGLGFYCCEDMQLAREWAVGRGRSGYVNSYTLNDDGLRVINLNSPQFTILHWLSVLTASREFDAPSQLVYQARDYIQTEFRVDTSSCDCITGYRADGCSYAMAQDFLEGRISYQQLRESLVATDTGRQFVIKSNRAFDRLLFNGYETVWSTEYYPVRAARERVAVEKYYGMLQEASRNSVTGGRAGKTGKTDDGTAAVPDSHPNQGRRGSGNALYIDQIVNERIRSYDPRLR